MSRDHAVRFEGSAGHTLVGTLDVPPKEPEGYALFAHCFTGGRKYQASRRISRALSERGLGVLRFDFAGVGDSSGSLADAHFSGNVEDLVRAADYLRTQHGPPSLIVGHSLGGAAVLAAAGQIPELGAVATIAAPSDPEHVTHLFAESLTEIHRHGRAEVTLAGRRFTISRDFVEDLQEQRQKVRIAALGLPLLVLHSPDDDVVGIKNANQIYRAARHPKSFISLDGADHLLTRRRDADRVAQLIAAWADPYLPETFTPEID